MNTRQFPGPMRKAVASPGLIRRPVGRPRGAGGVFPMPGGGGGIRMPPVGPPQLAAGAGPGVFPMPGRRLPPSMDPVASEAMAPPPRLPPEEPMALGGPGLGVIDRRMSPMTPTDDRPVFDKATPPWELPPPPPPPMDMEDGGQADMPVKSSLGPMRRMAGKGPLDEFEY